VNVWGWIFALGGGGCEIKKQYMYMGTIYNYVQQMQILYSTPKIKPKFPVNLHSQPLC
jgi:hypothetical protein